MDGNIKINMSTLFDSYTDSFCHELHLGSPVMGKTSKGFIYGHVVNFLKDKKGGNKYEIVPDLGYSKTITPKKSYKINENNVFLLTVKKSNK